MINHKKQAESNFISAKSAYVKRIKQLKEALKNDDITKVYRDEFSRIFNEMEFAVQINDIAKLDSLELQLKNIAEKSRP